MDRIVVDRSGIEYLLSTDSTFASSVQILAPTLLRSQILDGLYRSVASGLLTRAEGLERHDRFSRMKLRYLGDKVLRRTAWQIAEERG